MEATKFLRTTDRLGRIVIPIDLRKALDITPDTPLELLQEGDHLILRKYRAIPVCTLCGKEAPDAVMLHGKCVCADCRRTLLGE